SFVAAQRRLNNTLPAKTVTHTKSGLAPSRIPHPPGVLAKAASRKTMRMAPGAVRQSKVVSSNRQQRSKPAGAITAVAQR
ncbi:MAG TPA: hypothetical protein VE616_18150, partial [Candidatus Udaeobacter sp.]|nr:hypothetical protein [Candidatus Udaeobacter sp.]